MHCQLFTIRSISGDFQGYDYAPGTVNVYRYFSNGICNDHQYVLCSLCASLGGMDQKFCVGIVDFRCDSISHSCSVVAIYAVSPLMTGRRVDADIEYSMAHHKQSELSTMTAVWLLPVVTCVVAASSGAIVADVLPNPQHALWTIIVSYILWGIGLPLALMIMVIYFMRLTLHKLPPKAVIVSVFLPLGPMGQGGFG